MDATPELKYLAAVLVFLAGVAGTLVARRILDRQSGSLATRLANAFAGGVFLGAGLIHMLPDASGKFAALLGGADTYPHAALIAGVGFLLMLLLDKVLAQRPAGTPTDTVYPYVLALILSAHSVIVGVSLGLERHLIGAGAILIAILAHKSTAAMALTISLVTGRVDQVRSRNLRWGFLLATPAGIVLGTVWSRILQGTHAALTEGIFDSVAAGTFMYIAIADVLVEEFQSTHLGWMFAAAVVGFLGMALVAVWT